MDDTALKPEQIPIGLRERNKAVKLRRIRDAARSLFVQHGYDDATMRAIAERAEVGFGTLFTYASDKRDLLILIFNDDLDAVIERAYRTGVAERIFLDRLLAFFGTFYRFFVQQPELSRIVLREMTFYRKGLQAEQFHASTGRVIHHLASLVAAAQSQGDLATPAEPDLVANTLRSIFAAEIRRWIADDDPIVADGLARLRQMLALQIVGLQPGDRALGPS